MPDVTRRDRVEDLRAQTDAGFICGSHRVSLADGTEVRIRPVRPMHGTLQWRSTVPELCQNEGTPTMRGGGQ